MARHVGFDITERISINETCVSLLRVVDRAAHRMRAPWVTLTRRELAEVTGKSVHTTRRACQILVDQGLLVLRVSFGADGSHSNNESLVTRLGRDSLALLDEQAVS